MSDVQITVVLPEELAERAQAVGIDFSRQKERIIALLEGEIKRQEAQQRLRNTFNQIDALPDEIKPTPEEIESEIRLYHTEKAAKNQPNNI